MDGVMLWLAGVCVTWGVVMTVILCIQAWARGEPGKASPLEQSLQNRVPTQRFFAADPVRVLESRGVDEEIVNRVQRYLETEQNLVEQFVSHPSVQTLYVESDRTIGLN